MKLHKVWLLAAIFAMMLFVASRVQAQAAGGDATTVHNVQATAAVPAAAAEHADAHGAHEQPSLVDINAGTLIFTILVFVVLLFILRATAWKPILSGLKSREQAIREGLEAAAKAKSEAEKTAKELETKIAEVQRQGAQALAQAKADAIKLAENIRQQAETEAAALKERTLNEIDAAKQQALTEINTHAADLGTAVARKILQREVRVEDQHRLVEDSLNELAAAKN